MAFFVFRSPPLAGIDLRGTAQQKRLLVDTFANDRWRVPELLDRVKDADDIYFDSVSQVTLDRWSTARITLVGDAASSVSLFGGGSSLAIVAAFTFAGHLAGDAGDLAAAFRRYEAQHRRLVEPRQENVRLASTLLVPATSHGILLRNSAANLWPLAAAIGLARRLVSARR